MKNVLFLTPQVIVPPDDGGKQCMYHRIKSLLKQRVLSVSLVMANSEEQKRDEALVKDYMPELRETIVLPRMNASIKKSNYFLKIREAVKWLVSGKPRAAQTIESSENKKQLTKYILDRKYDVIVLEFPFCAELVELSEIKKADIKVALVMHNVESLFFKECSNLPGWIKKFESSRLKTYETKILKQVDHILSISPWDTMYMQKAWGINTVKYLPVYLEKREQTWRAHTETRYIVFNGSLSFYPNFHGMQWFLQNVFVNYVRIYPEIKLKITGKVNERIQKELERYKNVEFTGYVSEKKLEVIIINSMFSVVPIIKGSGIKIKLLESLSYGVPTVTTIHGAQGIPYKEEAPYLVGKDENEFLTQMRILTDSNERRKILGHRARMFFEMNYASQKNIQDWIASVSGY